MVKVEEGAPEMQEMQEAQETQETQETQELVVASLLLLLQLGCARRGGGECVA